MILTETGGSKIVIHTYIGKYTTVDIHTNTRTHTKRVCNLMCIYRTIYGLDATLDGGKCRGMITYYYSQPSPSPSLPGTIAHQICCRFYSERSRSKKCKQWYRRRSDIKSSFCLEPGVRSRQQPLTVQGSKHDTWILNRVLNLKVTCRTQSGLEEVVFRVWDQNRQLFALLFH